jgi:hypothetical protein
MKAANTCYCAYCNCNLVDSKRQYPTIVSEDLIMYFIHRITGKTVLCNELGEYTSLEY